jgi:hypothetical protein
VRDKILITLVKLIIILNLGHTADHFARGDFRRPITVETVPPIIVTLAINSILGFGLYFLPQKPDRPSVLGDRCGHRRGVRLAGAFQSLYGASSTVYLQ